MKKLNREKLVEGFRKIRESVKDKMTVDEINEEIAACRKEKRQTGNNNG